MKSSLKIVLSAISLVSTILVSAAAAPAASKVSTVDFFVEDEDVMANTEEFFEEIEIAQIGNDYALYEVKDETLKPTKFKEKPTEEVVDQKPSYSSGSGSSSSKNPSSSQSSSQNGSESQSGQTVAPPASSSAHSSFFAMLPLNRDAQTPAPNVQYLSYTVSPTHSENGVEILKFKSGTTYSLPVKEALKHVVANEVNNAMTLEAIKAQVVATHTYIKYYNDRGTIPSVGYKSTVPSKVDQAVEEVYDTIVTVNGKAVYTPYHACSAGSTQSSKEVWGGSLSHLVAVESKYDYLADSSQKNRVYEVTKTISESKVKSEIIDHLGVTPSGDPSTWFKFLDSNNNGYTSGNYVNKIVIAGKTTTGKNVRSIFGLRSACFDVKYSNGNFVFTTKGYGHGVGLSQWGAHFYAIKQGWNYEQIVTHYFNGVVLAKVA